MASFSTWQPFENRVSKTRFINKKILKTLSLKRSLTSPDRIRSQREKESDQREGDQIRGRTTWVARPGQRVAGRATQAARPGSRDLGRPSQAARPSSRKPQVSRDPCLRETWGSRGLRFATAWVDLIFYGFFLRRLFFFFFFLLALNSFLLVLFFCYI